MKDFLLTEQLQREFCGAVPHENLIYRFLRDNDRILRKISKKFPLVKAPSKDPFGSVCEFICDHFLDLLVELSNPYTLRLQDGTVGHKFHRHLMSAKYTNDWLKFYEEHEIVFDAIIQWAREQDVLRVEVERNGRRYRSLKDARMDRLANRAEFPLLNFPSDSGVHEEEDFQGWRRKSLSIETPRGRGSGPGLGYGKTAGNGLRRSNTIHSEDIGRVERTPRPRSSHSQSAYHYDNPLPQPHHDPLLNYNPTQHFPVTNPPRPPYSHPKLTPKLIYPIPTPVEQGQDLATESERRIRFFHQSEAMNLRWDDQRNEWDSWLKSMRDAVLTVKMNFVNFGFKNFATIEKQYDFYMFRGEITKFTEHVEVAYNKLEYDFRALSVIGRHYDDQLFIKVLQKIVQEVAERLCELLEVLRGFKFDEPFIHRMQDCEEDINPRDIPTASTLRQICKEARLEDYKDVKAPRKPGRP